MDAFDPIFEQLSLTARVFFAGELCQLGNFDDAAGAGHLHLLRTGRVWLRIDGRDARLIEQPSAILIAHPRKHALVPLDPQGIDLVCASVDLGASVGSPIATALPECLVLPVEGEGARTIAPVLELLFAEAFDRAYGRQAGLDRLAEYFLIQVFRHLIASGRTPSGLFAALADPRLSRAVSALHERPAHAWTLEELADLAGMSRARFAVNFRETLGTTPHAYLTDWRLTLAKDLIRRGRPLKQIASQVGYPDAAAFARVFTRRLGVSPTAWASTAGPSRGEGAFDTQGV